MADEEAATSEPSNSLFTCQSHVQNAARLLAQPISSHRTSRVDWQPPTKILLAEQRLIGDFGADLFSVAALPAASACLITLDLSFNELDDRFWTHWTPELASVEWAALTTLNLANNHFSTRSIAPLAAFVAQCPRLAHLDLSLNPLAGYGNKSLLTLLPLITALESKKTLQYLQVLEMSCTGLMDASIARFVDAEFAKQLTNLYLRSNALTDEAAVALSRLLPVSKLKVLSLAGNVIGDRGAASLAFVLDQTPALQTLDLEENQIAQAGITSFYHALTGVTTPFPLRYLHLARNVYAPEPLLTQIRSKLHAKIIETHLIAGPLLPNASTTTLNLNGSMVKRHLLLECSLTDRYVCTAVETIRASTRWQQLEVLDLSGNEVGARAARDIGLFLALQPVLRVLNLSSCLISDEVIVGLADGLEPNTNLQELNLEHNWITDVGAKQLYLKAFPSNLHRRIHLSLGNSLSSECKLLLTAIWQAHDLRKRFAKEFANAERLELSGRALRQYGSAVIVEELVATSTSTCRSIDFSRNGLGDEGAKAVAQLLRSYPRLEELDVSFNDIGDEGAIAMAQALAENSTLVSFALHSVVEGSQVKPKLQEKGLRQLALAIQGHKALVKVDLRDNVSSPAVVRAYVEMLHGNRTIQKFNGSNTAVFLSRYDA